eukprot:TRINITY_DN4235_c0_g1_i2.p2 TRINITY_DN4235_c0_g1~~TRINITY_DN4235_c0_g1_i2.p2  ORF type:complete len:182 (+),score=0.09 TRINITY_DN4235_c0_g1_i2:249-794(+)
MNYLFIPNTQKVKLQNSKKLFVDSKQNPCICKLPQKYITCIIQNNQKHLNQIKKHFKSFLILPYFHVCTTPKKEIFRGKGHPYTENKLMRTRASQTGAPQADKNGTNCNQSISAIRRLLNLYVYSLQISHKLFNSTKVKKRKLNFADSSTVKLGNFLIITDCVYILYYCAQIKYIIQYNLN